VSPAAPSSRGAAWATIALPDGCASGDWSGCTLASTELEVVRCAPRAIRRAIELHSPDLARTLSQLEERFLALCEKYGIPSPRVNRKVCGLMVDALWPEQRLVVELDGARAHATPAAMERDRDRDLTLRAAGFEILRYTWHQVTQQPDAVVADLRRALAII
jgi:very-short-patch-repair endonuclease